MHLFNIIKDRAKPRKRRHSWSADSYSRLGRILMFASVVLLLVVVKIKTTEYAQAWVAKLLLVAMGAAFLAGTISLRRGLKMDAKFKVVLLQMLDRSNPPDAAELETRDEKHTLDLVFNLGAATCGALAVSAWLFKSMHFARVAFIGYVILLSAQVWLYAKNKRRK